jgi:hypothetical protein
VLNAEAIYAIYGALDLGISLLISDAIASHNSFLVRDVSFAPKSTLGHESWNHCFKSGLDFPFGRPRPIIVESALFKLTKALVVAI